MTIKEIMQIDATRSGKASGCVVNLLGIYHDVKKETIPEKFKAQVGGSTSINVYYIILKFSVKSADSGKEHIVYVRLCPDFNLSRIDQSEVEVYCDCQDFMYRSAYELNKAGSAFVTPKIQVRLGQSLSDAPKAEYKTSKLCKHSYAALQWLLSNYSSVMVRLI